VVNGEVWMEGSLKKESGDDRNGQGQNQGHDERSHVIVSRRQDGVDGHGHRATDWIKYGVG